MDPRQESAQPEFNKQPATPAAVARAHRVRLALMAMALAALALAVTAAIRLSTPRHEKLRIVWPGVGADAELIKTLQAHAGRSGLELDVVNARELGSLDTLHNAQADLCLVSSLEDVGAGVSEVLTLRAEVLHVLVRPQLVAQGVSGLRGKRVYCGPPGSNTEALARAVFEQAGWRIDHELERVNGSLGELLDLPRNARPDGVMVLAPIGGETVAKLADSWGYRPVPVNFADALARTEPSIEPALIPLGAYDALAPSPAQIIQTVGSRVVLVARDSTPPRAIQMLVGVLLDRDFQRSARLTPFGDERLEQGASYALHAGAAAYLRRNEPLLTPEVLTATEDLRSLIGALVVGGVVAWHWWKRRGDAFRREMTHRFSELERDALIAESAVEVDVDTITALRRDVSKFKSELVGHVLTGVNSQDDELRELIDQADRLRHTLLLAAVHQQQRKAAASGLAVESASPVSAALLSGAVTPRRRRTRE